MFTGLGMYQRIQSLGDGYDSCFKRNRFAAQAPRVAAAVPALVMAGCNIERQLQTAVPARGSSKNAFCRRRMRPKQGLFLGAQSSGFANGFGYRKHPQVVQAGGSFYLMRLGGRETQRFRQESRRPA